MYLWCHWCSSNSGCSSCCSSSNCCVIVFEGRTGREITALKCVLGGARVVAAAAGATHAWHAGHDRDLEVADLGQEVTDLGRETADLGHKTAGREVAVPGQETECDRAPAATVPRGTERVDCRPASSVRGQLGQGQGRGQTLSCIRGHRGEFGHVLFTAGVQYMQTERERERERELIIRCTCNI